MIHYSPSAPPVTKSASPSETSAHPSATITDTNTSLQTSAVRTVQSCSGTVNVTASPTERSAMVKPDVDDAVQSELHSSLTGDSMSSSSMAKPDDTVQTEHCGHGLGEMRNGRSEKAPRSMEAALSGEAVRSCEAVVLDGDSHAEVVPVDSGQGSVSPHSPQQAGANPAQSQSTGADKPCVVTPPLEQETRQSTGSKNNVGILSSGDVASGSGTKDSDVKPGKTMAARAAFGASSEFEDSGMAEGQDSNTDDQSAPQSSGAIHHMDKSSVSAADSIKAKLAARIPAAGKMATSYTYPTLCPTPLPDPEFDLDMNDIRGTPMFYRTDSPVQSTSSSMFTWDKFYFMPASMPAHPQAPYHRATASSPLERSLLHLKNSEETSILADKCFVLKITPISVLMMLHARMKTDSLAQKFMRQLPSGMMGQVVAGIGMQAKECAVL